MKKVIVIDAETTGLNAKTDEILQLTILAENGDILFNEYFCPTKHTSWPEAEQIHHITYDMVKDCQPFIYHAKEIQAILDSADVVVGYNHSFDLAFLENAGIHTDNRKNYDLMLEFSQLIGEWDNEHNHYKWFKLKECADYLGYNWGKDHTHDSLADCKACLYCYKKMIAGETAHGGMPNKNQPQSSYNTKSKRNPLPSIIVAAIALIGACAFAIFTWISTNNKDIMLEEANIDKTQYNDYIKLLDEGSLNDDGSYKTNFIDPDEMHVGKVHVTFAKNPYMNISYYKDASCTDKIDEDDCYLASGESIYIKEINQDIYNNLPNSRYHFYAFQINAYDSDNNISLVNEVRSTVGQIYTADYGRYPEIAIIPVGASSQRKLTLLVKNTNEEGKQQELDIGHWSVDKADYNQSIGLNPFASYSVEYDLKDFASQYYIYNTVPTAEYEQNDNVQFGRKKATDNIDTFIVELHPYINLTIVDGTVGIVDNIPIIGNLTNEKKISLIEINSNSISPKETNNSLLIDSQYKIKCGDKINIHINKAYNLTCDDFPLDSPSDLVNEDKLYTIIIPDEPRYKYTLRIGYAAENANGELFTNEVAAHCSISLYKDNEVLLKDGDQQPSGNTTVILKIVPEEGYYLTGKDVKKGSNIYEKKMKYKEYLEDIDEIIKTHPVEEYIDIELLEKDEYGKFTYKVDGHKLKDYTPIISLQANQQLTIQYTLDKDSQYYLINEKNKQVTSASKIITVDHSMDNTKIARDDYFVLKEKVKK